MIQYFKQAGSKINLATNGSYKSAEWWKQLGSLLDEQDQVTFAIDGLPDSFTTYRINANWDSIQSGIKVLRDYPVKLHWQYILFEYNKHQISQAQILAVDLGFDKFFTIDSERWDNGKEQLTPIDISDISKAKIKWKLGQAPEVEAKCKLSLAQHYISADGFYTPCCWSAEHRWYYKTEFYKNQNLYNISKTTITKVLANLKDFYSTLEDAKLNYCTFNCPKL